MYKAALTNGIVFAMLAVILGAFGAHGLKSYIMPDQLQTFETGVRYQMYHGFALLAVGIVYRSFPFKQLRIATILFIAGILLFSGSIYLMTALKVAGEVGIRQLGMVTPIGGLCFVAGWILFVFGIVMNKEQNSVRRSSSRS